MPRTSLRSVFTAIAKIAALTWPPLAAPPQNRRREPGMQPLRQRTGADLRYLAAEFPEEQRQLIRFAGHVRFVQDPAASTHAHTRRF